MFSKKLWAWLDMLKPVRAALSRLIVDQSEFILKKENGPGPVTVYSKYFFAQLWFFLSVGVPLFSLQSKALRCGPAVGATSARGIA